MRCPNPADIPCTQFQPNLTYPKIKTEKNTPSDNFNTGSELVSRSTTYFEGNRQILEIYCTSTTFFIVYLEVFTITIAVTLTLNVDVLLFLLQK